MICPDTASVIEVKKTVHLLIRFTSFGIHISVQIKKTIHIYPLMITSSFILKSYTVNKGEEWRGRREIFGMRTADFSVIAYVFLYAFNFCISFKIFTSMNSHFCYKTLSSWSFDITVSSWNHLSIGYINCHLVWFKQYSPSNSASSPTPMSLIYSESLNLNVLPSFKP